MLRLMACPSGRPMGTAWCSNPIEKASMTCTGLSSGAGADELLLESDQNKAPTDWSSDGRFLLFRTVDPRTGYDLWVLPVSGDKKPFPFLKTPFEEREGQFSSDGKWIAYQSNESGGTPAALFPVRIAGGPVSIVDRKSVV